VADEEKKVDPQGDVKAQINAKLAPFGMTFDQVAPIVQPFVTAAVKEVLAGMNIPEILNTSVAKTVDARMSSFMEALQKQQQGRDDAGGSGAPAATQPAPGAPPASGALNIDKMLMVAQMLGLGPKAPTGLEGISQMAELAKAFGAISQAFVTPILEAQESGRRTAIGQITTLAKSGGKMPWESDEKKPV